MKGRQFTDGANLQVLSVLKRLRDHLLAVLRQRLTTWADVETGLLGLFGVSASSKARW